MKMSWFSPVAGFLLLAVLSGAGCSGSASDDRDPNIKRARERRAVADYAGAIKFYEEALEKRPGLARIHWEIASIYDQRLTNELRAIYHYERYLELDPRADRRQLVEELIAAAKLSYAASLPARPSEAIQEIARLKREMDHLKRMLEEAREHVAQGSGVSANADRPAPSPGPATTIAPPAARPQPVPARATAPETYTVQPGDNLSRIAQKMYQDTSKWKVIFDANRDTLPTERSLRPGQTLLIPR